MQPLHNVETWHLAFNTAASFMTNTNWQAYSGETTLSYLTQMLGLTVQNFLSAATGAAVAIALIRGLVRKNTGELGNFWADIIRCTTRILLPICVVVTLLLVSQGQYVLLTDLFYRFLQISASVLLIFSYKLLKKCMLMPRSFKYPTQ